MGFEAGKLPVAHFGNLQLLHDDDLAYRLFSKYPTRGNSVLLDNLRWVGGTDRERSDTT